MMMRAQASAFSACGRCRAARARPACRTDARAGAACPPFARGQWSSRRERLRPLTRASSFLLQRGLRLPRQPAQVAFGGEARLRLQRRIGLGAQPLDLTLVDREETAAVTPKRLEKARKVLFVQQTEPQAHDGLLERKLPRVELRGVGVGFLRADVVF